MQHQADVLVVGSGAAGLALALRLADQLSIALVSKGPLADGCTLWAQGGIAAVLDPEDSVDAHVSDTINVGAGLCDAEVVRAVVAQGKECIEWLVERGVPFTPAGDSKPGQFHLGREGGHSHRRIVHAADATGRAVETTLEGLARAHPNIQIFEEHIAVDLITARKVGRQPNRCLGIYVLDRQAGKVHVIRARHVVLATGGASKVYLYTSNPDSASGDGIAMGWRAGCRVANLEFNQFHPTCLYHPEARTFLLTEAIRGEGGRLLLPDGARFMDSFDARGELAPRDIVARAIDHEMKRLGAECVYLDISHRPADFITSHFPTVYQRCLEYGYDMTKGPLPVVPAAHYTCGGLMTDVHGRTDVPGLFAIGEVAHTGLHGANRLASNSLLECLVFAKAASEAIREQGRAPAMPEPLPEWDESRVTDSDEMVVVSHNWDELRRFMWDYVGIVRTDKRLQRAKRRADVLLHEIAEYYGHFRVTDDLLELRNLALVADLIIRSAQSRRESRGLHYTLDYPPAAPTEVARATVLTPANYTSPA